MSSITLKVTPEELKRKSGQIQDRVNKIEKDWSSIQNIVSNTKNYWQGEASDAHYNQMKGFADDMNRIIKRLKEHPDDLLVMADLYEKTENEIITEASALESDIIS